MKDYTTASVNSIIACTREGRKILKDLHINIKEFNDKSKCKYKYI